jgi:3-oxoacyl-[acyl-carrier protein] reductase
MTERKLVLVAAGNSELGLPITEFLLADKKFEVFSTFRSENKKSSDLKNLFECKAMSHCLKTDLRDSNQVASLFSRVSTFGQIWGVLNFAGEATANRLVRTTQREIENSILNNLMPAINLTTEFFRYANKETIPGGRVVHISSVTVRRPVPGTIPYVIAKSGIEGLVKASAEEAGRYKIAINALRLGYFDRGMATRAVPSEMLSEISKKTATLSLGTPENLVASLSYLLSEESAFHTGSIIDLDGGLV